MRAPPFFTPANGGTSLRKAAKKSVGAPAPLRVEVLEVAGSSGGKMRHTAFAKKLGIRPNLVRQVYKRGGLPGSIEHSAYILMVPTRLLRLAEAYGLRQVEIMAKAGQLS